MKFNWQTIRIRDKAILFPYPIFRNNLTMKMLGNFINIIDLKCQMAQTDLFRRRCSVRVARINKNFKFYSKAFQNRNYIILTVFPKNFFKTNLFIKRYTPFRF